MPTQTDNSLGRSAYGRTCDLCAADRPGEHTSNCPTLFIEPACVHERSDGAEATSRGGYRRICNDTARAVSAALRKREALGLQVFTEHMGAHDVRTAWRHYVIGYCEALELEVDVVLQAVKCNDANAEGR
jgi:hypothetical protein